jgi:hypothetical protein
MAKHERQIHLEAGETVKRSAKGRSMEPRIMNGQEYLQEPVKLEDVKVNDIVFCKVRGKYMNHLVTAIDKQRGLQISNNHGHVNGWTKQVYGRVKEILNE